MDKKNSLKKRIFKGIAGTLIIVTVVSVGATELICGRIFRRAEPQKSNSAPVSSVACDADSVTFQSRGVQLRGWLYNVEKSRALIVMVHGFHDDQDCFSLLVKSFTKQGFSVLTFDGTAAGTSDGDRIVGIQQARYDTLAALDYVASRSELSDIPVVLFGYSMGAYGVLTAMNDADASPAAVIAVAGCNTTTDLMVSCAEKYVSVFANLGRPFLWMRDRITSGADGDKTAAEALENAAWPVLLVQSADDTIVPYELSAYCKGIDSGNKNVSCLLVDAAGHADHLGVLPRSDDGSGLEADETEKSLIDDIVRFIEDSLKH